MNQIALNQILYPEYINRIAMYGWIKKTPKNSITYIPTQKQQDQQGLIQFKHSLGLNISNGKHISNVLIED